ncbi:MAG: hypothetical protein QW303_05980 [Nitrososphaerota archaeon]
MNPIYDPLEFIDKVGILTIAIVGSFVTIKFLNSIYENIYEPFINTVVDSKRTGEYYLKIGKFYIPIDDIVKEFIKWVIIIVLLMIFYNIFAHKYKKN